MDYFKDSINSFENSKKIVNFDGCLLSSFKQKMLEDKLRTDTKLLSLYEKYGNDFDKSVFFDDLINLGGLKLVSPQSLAARRGKFFELFVEDLVNQNVSQTMKVTTQKFPKFLEEFNKTAEIPVEIPDLVIESSKFNAVIYVQCDLWNGGEQTNRGEKYHSNSSSSLYQLCKDNGYNFYTVVSSDPRESGKTEKSRGRKILKKGRLHNILLWPYDLLEKLQELK